MESLLTIILIIFAVLQIILFFKIWNATSEISKIRELIEFAYNKNEHKEEINFQNIISKQEIQNKKQECTKIETDIELYSWILDIKSKQEFQVIEILDKNTFLCVNEEHSNGIKLKRFEIELTSK